LQQKAQPPYEEAVPSPRKIEEEPDNNLTSVSQL